MLTDTGLERRKPVWMAFSEFWLDSELDDEDLSRIAAVAAASGYSIAELHDIYLYEATPVVYPNCWSVAGAWTAFDDEWLYAAARRNAEHRSLWLRFWVFIRIAQPARRTIVLNCPPNGVRSP
jgi:hypothetical protein